LVGYYDWQKPVLLDIVMQALGFLKRLDPQLFSQDTGALLVLP
jgi:hypothetical protein